MSRPLRIEYEDAYYHVMNRGRGRQWIFPGEKYYEEYINCLSEAHKRFGIEIHAYCLMGNHYHLLIKTPRGNLGRAMRHIDGVYTQRHNRLKQTDGSLFRGRYKAIVVDANSYLLQVSRYIHRNPIELKKPLVNKLEDHLWSSFSAYLNQVKVPDWLNRNSVYDELGSRAKYNAYKVYIEQGNDEEMTRFYSLKNTPSILGDKSFKEFAFGQSQSLDVEIDKKGLKQPVSLKKIVATVAVKFIISEQEIYVAKRGRGVKNVPRWIAMKLCQQLGGAKLIEIAKVFNIGHYSTVSQTIGRLNILMLEDSEIASDFNMLSQDLTP
ncbi:MAG: transposase [Methylococcales bacterium]